MLGLRQRDNGYERSNVRPEVREVQDEFLNVYRRTFDNEKNWARRFTEEVSPQTQNDLNAIESVESKKDSFIKILQEKLNLIDAASQGFLKLSGTSVKEREKIENFGKSYDIIRPYNEIIREYLNPAINTRTREDIKTRIQEIIPLLNQIIYIADTTFRNKFFRPPYSPDKIAMGKRFLNPMLTTYISLLIIQKNLFRGTYSTINKPQLDVQYNEWLSSLNDGDRGFIKAIELPTGSTQAEKRRMELIEEDRGYPLSADEILTLRNSMFGIASTRTLSPEEILLLEQEALRDKFNREAIEKSRALSRAPAIIIPPGVPFPEAVAAPEERMLYISEERAKEFDDFVNESDAQFTSFISMFTEEYPKSFSDNERRNAIKGVRDFVVTTFTTGYRILTGEMLSEKVIDDFIKEVINTKSGGILTDDEIDKKTGNTVITDAGRENVLLALKKIFEETINNLTGIKNFGVIPDSAAGEVGDAAAAAAGGEGEAVAAAAGGEGEAVAVAARGVGKLNAEPDDEDIAAAEFGFGFDNIRRFISEKTKLLAEYIRYFIDPEAFIMPPVAKQRERIKYARDFIINVYKNGFNLIKKRPPTVSEIETYITQAVNSRENLTDESIDKPGRPPLSKPALRREINNSLRDAMSNTESQLGSVLRKNLEKIPADGGPGGPGVIGEGRPRYKVSQAIRYDDTRNDPYLIR